MYTWAEMVKANDEMKLTPVKGKNYAEVSQRIKAFRSVCPHGAIVTEMLSNVDGVCVFRATVYDEEQNIIGTGTAYEKETSSYINKTSYIENCETSAVGRALGMCGFGIDTSIASAEEVSNAIANQQNDQPQELQEYKPKQLSPRQQLFAKLREKGIDVDAYAQMHNLTKSTSNETVLELLADLEG